MQSKITGRAQTGVSILKGITKSQFSRIHNSVVFYLINPKVAVEVPAYQGRLHTKFEENCVKFFRDMSEQTFKFFSSFFSSSSFRTLEKITLTCKYNNVLTRTIRFGKRSLTLMTT